MTLVCVLRGHRPWHADQSNAEYMLDLQAKLSGDSTVVTFREGRREKRSFCWLFFLK